MFESVERKLTDKQVLHFSLMFVVKHKDSAYRLLKPVLKTS